MPAIQPFVVLGGVWEVFGGGGAWEGFASVWEGFWVVFYARPLILVKFSRFYIEISDSKTQVERLNLGPW